MYEGMSGKIKRSTFSLSGHLLLVFRQRKATSGQGIATTIKIENFYDD